ncbi:hypothetical protein LUZ60_011783 [Juncus effusus]|nr:hypothetical protein LUZ60_011783 [Juncus effusus]
MGLTSCQFFARYYINYKMMKRRVNQYVQQIQNNEKTRRQVLKDFSKMLDDQVETIVLFMLEKQGLLAKRLEELTKRKNALENQNIHELSILRESYRKVGQDLLNLLGFVDLNQTGVRKILKKFDKRFGYKFTDYYLTTRSNHEYSQLKQVFKYVGIGAVIGSLTRNLTDLREIQGSYLSIYDQPTSLPNDPMIDKITETFNSLTNSTNFLRFLGQSALIPQPYLSAESQSKPDSTKYHFMSLFLNLFNTFLYMVNTYIVVPTADDYSVSLGAAPTVCGIIIGSMAVAQIFSSVYFSAWSNKSYFKPLLFSCVVLCLGNVLYALAYDLDSLAVLLIGRVLCGMGSARAVNRRYISDQVPTKYRMQASAAFVSASALGMACGPALSGLLQTNFRVLGFTFDENTLPGWVMAFAWVLYLVLLGFSFKEPEFEKDVNDDVSDDVSGGRRAGSSSGNRVNNEEIEDGLAQPLLLTNEKKTSGDNDDLSDSDDSSKDARKPASSLSEAYKLLTPSVKVQLFVYFMLKFVMEILLSGSSVITSFYFNWDTSSVSIFLAILGLTVLPVNVIVGNYISNMFEDRQILVVSEILVLIGVMFSFHVIGSYTVAQYVCGALLLFVSAEVLEGVNLSLLSRVMSSRLSRGTYNGGLLSTEAGTFARVLADCAITIAGSFGEEKLLNATLIPSLVVGVLTISATLYTYRSLF